MTRVAILRPWRFERLWSQGLLHLRLRHLRVLHLGRRRPELRRLELRRLELRRLELRHLGLRRFGLRRFGLRGLGRRRFGLRWLGRGPLGAAAARAVPLVGRGTPGCIGGDAGAGGGDASSRSRRERSRSSEPLNPEPSGLGAPGSSRPVRTLQALGAVRGEWRRRRRRGDGRAAVVAVARHPLLQGGGGRTGSSRQRGRGLRGARSDRAACLILDLRLRSVAGLVGPAGGAAACPRFSDRSGWTAASVPPHLPRPRRPRWRVPPPRRCRGPLCRRRRSRSVESGPVPGPPSAGEARRRRPAVRQRHRSPRSPDLRVYPRYEPPPPRSPCSESEQR